MTMTENRHEVSRRAFVGGTAGLTFAFATPGFLGAMTGAVAAATEAGAKTVGGWITIAPSGAITIAAPAAEMGQGVFTAIPMIMAEEMDADWAQVTATFPPAVTNNPIYGNPRLGNSQTTVASQAVPGYWDKVRLVGAQARRVLMQAAAEKWGVPLAEVTTGPSVVIHEKSNRRMSYGEVAAFATVPDELPKLGEADFKKPSQYRIIGRDTARLDIPDKVAGKTVYGMDVQVPNMVYATMLRAPVEGAAPEAVNDAQARAVPGILQTVKLKDAVAIVGETVEAVFKARDLLDVTWKGGATAGFDSDKAMGEYVTRARNLEDKGQTFKSHGDRAAAFLPTAKVISAEYQSDYVHHAQMEPMNMTVSVSEAGDEADIWVGTQAQAAITGTAAGFLKTKPEKIRVHQHFMGGGFGRRIYWDLVPYALQTAKEVKRPVKMIWTREQDVKSAFSRPMSAHFMQAAVDDSGKIVGWTHRIVAEATTGYMQAARLEAAKGLDPLTLEGSEHKYEIENVSIDYLIEKHGTALAAWRAIGSGFNKFAIEAFVDDLARELKVDPLEFRMRMLSKHPRGRKILETVAEMAEWTKKRPEGRALGLAYVDVWATPAAAIAEVSVDRNTGQIRVHKFWNAVNPGIVINPANVAAQSESNVVYGLSQALKERISFMDGEVEQNNFSDYEVLRMSETPEIFTKVIATEDKPTGIGEIVLPLIAPAVSNAMLALTGKRLGHMPFTPERVKAALA